MNTAEWVALITVVGALALVVVRWWRMRPGLVDRLHRLGVQAMKTGHYQEALRYFQLAINRDSMAFASRLNCGLVLMHLDQIAEARQTFDELIKDFPGYTRAMLGRAELAQRTGDATAALADLDRALAIDPTLVDVYLQRASIYGNAGDLDAALDALQQARELAPDAPQVSTMVASLLLKRGDYAGAIRAADQALRTVDDLNLHVIRANALDMSDQLPAAYDEYSRVLSVQPDHQQALFDRAAVALRMRQWEAAQRDFEAVLTLNPNLNRAYLGHALAAKMLSDLATMRADVDLILRRDPESADALQLRSMHHFYYDAFNESLQDALQALKLKAPNSVATALASQVLRQQRRFDAAAAFLEQAFTLSPNDALVLLEWGLLQLAIKTPLDHYIPRLKDAVPLHPENAELLNGLAWIYCLEQKPVLALPYIQRVFALQDDPWYHDTRALIWASLDNLAAAKEDWLVYIDHMGQFDSPYHQRTKTLRQGWLDAIEEGRNPITPEVLEQLRFVV